MENLQNQIEHFYDIKDVGTIHTFDIAVGVTLSFYDLHVYDWKEEEDKIHNPNVIEINYCENGRYECEFNQDTFYYLGEGELAISRLSDKKKISGFPLGFYKGINILIDLDVLGEEFTDLLIQFEIDKQILIEKWKINLPCRIIKETPQINSIFKPLYEKGWKTSMQYGYLKCKLLEVLLLFERYDFDVIALNQHFRKNQVINAKHVRKHLEQELDREITLKELAKEHGLSESSIKRCFQAIYGKSPNQYRKEYRMQCATKLLLQTNLSVADIGMQLGYLNCSKFSSAFRSVMHMTPTEYQDEKKYQ